MPTSTFPLWWKTEETMLAVLDAARGGASYQELDALIGQHTGSRRAGNLRAWVNSWRERPSDRPQARIAKLIASYGPPATTEKSKMMLVDRVLSKHLSQCECGAVKDHPDDVSCRECLTMELASPARR